MAVAGAAAERAEVDVLGGFSCRSASGQVGLPARGERLLAFLALHRRPARRQQLAGTLWADSPDDRAAASLRSTLWRLPRPRGIPLVGANPTHVWLQEGTEVDLWHAEESLQALSAGRTPDTVAADPAAALHMLDADVLPDWGEDWVLLERERHRQRRLHALEGLCREHSRQGRFETALALGLAAVAGEPLRESAHRAVIEVHLAEGNPGEALRQFDLYRRLLRTELGLPPSPAIRTLVAHLLGRPTDARPRPVGAPA
jgi:DNA-binding SARP family transcriptional activator